MELFKIIMFEYILGYVIQGFTIVLGVYAFNRQKIKLKSYIFTSIFIFIISFLVKILPINLGIHTILNMVILFLVCTLLFKMPAFNTMRSAILVTLLLIVVEVIYTALIVLVCGKEQFEISMLNPVDKAIFALPSTILFVIITVFLYLILTKKK